MLIAVYADGQVIEPPCSVRRVVIVNASRRDGIFLRLQSGAEATVSDISGNLLRKETLSSGIREIAVPSTGHLLLAWKTVNPYYVPEQ